MASCRLPAPHPSHPIPSGTEILVTQPLCWVLNWEGWSGPSSPCRSGILWDCTEPQPHGTHTGSTAACRQMGTSHSLPVKLNKRLLGSREGRRGICGSVVFFSFLLPREKKEVSYGLEPVPLAVTASPRTERTVALSHRLKVTD